MHKEGALFPLATARHKYEIDMCTGSLPQKILLFSLPLMATGMLQLLFNAADIIVVGRYVGSHALAAVGSNGSIINLIVNLFMGISIGGSAVIAQHYGAAQYEDVSEATHTCMLVGLISGFFVMVVGVVCTPRHPAADGYPRRCSPTGYPVSAHLLFGDARQYAV